VFIKFGWLLCALVIGTAGCADITQPPMTPAIRVLRERRVNDFHYTKNLTLDEVSARWGPPDGHRGSGIPYVEWDILDDKDAAEVWLYFGPDKKLYGALLLTHHFKHLMK